MVGKEPGEVSREVMESSVGHVEARSLSWRPKGSLEERKVL